MKKQSNVFSEEKIYRMTTISLPSQWRFGVASHFGKRLSASMDISSVQWEDAARTLKEKEMYSNTYYFGTGVRFIPSTALGASYLKTLPISAGFKMGTLYYKSYPLIDSVFEKAVTAGIELPLKDNNGTVIMSYEFGTRGDKGKNGWDETYMSIGLSLIGIIK